MGQKFKLGTLVLLCFTLMVTAQDPLPEAETDAADSSQAETNTPDEEGATEATSSEETSPAEETPAEEISPEEAAVRKCVESYVTAFNSADAAAVAAHWSDAGEWISPDGTRYKGKEAILKEMEIYFNEATNHNIDIIDAKVRILAPTVAIEEGVARVVRSGDPPSETSYIAIHVKQGDEWKLESVRETAIPTTSTNYEHLRNLEWLVGEWVDEQEDGSVELSCSWTKNKNFFTRSFTVKIEDRIDMQGTQVIGWDAVNQQVRSWMFDSTGGFAEATWTQENGNRWMIKATQHMSDGSKGSSINTLTYNDPNSFTWESTGRETDGELQPNLGPITVVRKK